jgi:hypothetical protein
MDGVIGFEPMDDGIKIRWLTTCRHPNNYKVESQKLRILPMEINDFCGFWPKYKPKTLAVNGLAMKIIDREFISD